MINNTGNSKITTYKSLKREDLRSTIHKIFSKPSVPRQIVMYTGEIGMWNFNWMITYGDMLQCKYYISSFNKIKSFKYFSLFNKSGIYKLKVTGTKFEFFKGTVLINTIDDVVNQWTVNSGDMYSEITKGKINKVNKYIKKLNKLQYGNKTP